VTSPNQGLFLPQEGKGKEPGNEDGTTAQLLYNKLHLKVVKSATSCCNIMLQLPMQNFCTTSFKKNVAHFTAA
jgi:hypothetical protein